MSTTSKGAAAERKARKILEAAGYTVIRSAASKGPADLAAFNGHGFRLIQVKRGTARASVVERETLQNLIRPDNATVEVWRFPKYAREPIIEWL